MYAQSVLPNLRREDQGSNRLKTMCYLLRVSRQHTV